MSTPHRPLPAGELVAGRFVLGEVAGAGGMGTVFRAEDQHTGETVAVKVLHGVGAGDAERFAREGRVLAELRHPGIVRFIDHGVAPAGYRYLAMEWLEGESLMVKLKKSRPTVEETVVLVGALAQALAAAHRRGVVHRDLKPSNVFLVGDDLAHPRILDFGVAKLRGDEELRTATGAVLGTPGYMSPEQARGSRDIAPCSDVFSLGVLFFRCLTGRMPFEGRDALALLMRVMLEDPPRVRDVRADVLPALDDLVARMLAKAPERRPKDAAAISSALETIGDVSGPPASMAPESVAAITTSERRVLCVVLVRLASFDDDAPTVRQADGSTDNQLEKIAGRFGGNLAALVAGSIVISFSSAEAIQDQAVRAARCALAVRDQAPTSPIAIASGRGGLTTQLRVGEVIDRGIALLREGDASIRVDEATASLLEARFDLANDARGRHLRGERSSGMAVRTLLGKPTPIVGRDRELLHLESFLQESIDEPIARAVLVTGLAGVGKSRLRYELLRRVDRRGDQVEIWMAQGDPLTAGAPYALLGQALKRAAGILDGEPLEARRERLRARVTLHVPARDAERVTEFLGELVGAPFPDADSVQLRAARRDAMVMGDQIRSAWEDFVRAECDANPLLFVIEDLHWGDLPSVRLLDATLRLLADRPLMVLALARPDVYDLFPRLWAERGVQEIRLGVLTRKASEKLVRQALGAVGSDVVDRIIARAEGNAFFLEELIRAAAQGQTDALPGSVLAVVQARLESLDPDARRVLRAGAVFGQTFYRGGVATLLGGDVQLDDWLRDLVEQEVLTERPNARFPGEREYAFRHALVRDAAYDMLVDADRALGHQLCAEWLQTAGETEAMVLAEHWERGGKPENATRFYRRAAEQALEANDFVAAIERAERAFERSTDREEKGRLRTLQAEASRWSGQLERAEQLGVEALDLLSRQAPIWCQAAAEVALASGRLGHLERLVQTGEALLEVTASSPPNGIRLVSVFRAALQLYYTGHAEIAFDILERLERVAEQVAVDDPAVAARLEQMRVAVAGEDLAERHRHVRLAAESFRRAGDRRNLATQQVNVGYGDLTLGFNEAACETLGSVLEVAERMGLVNVIAVAKHNLGIVLMRLGRLDEACRVEAEAVKTFAGQRDRRLEGAARAHLASFHRVAGDLDAAEREARAAAAVTETYLPTYAQVLGTLALILVERGQIEEGLRCARRAREIVAELGSLDDGEATVQLAYPLALLASGDRAGAAGAAVHAKARLDVMAAGIRDEAMRAQFFSGVPEHARILELARSLGV